MPGAPHLIKLTLSHQKATTDDSFTNAEPNSQHCATGCGRDNGWEELRVPPCRVLSEKHVDELLPRGRSKLLRVVVSATDAGGRVVLRRLAARAWTCCGTVTMCVHTASAAFAASRLASTRGPWECLEMLRVRVRASRGMGSVTRMAMRAHVWSEEDCALANL